MQTFLQPRLRREVLELCAKRIRTTLCTYFTYVTHGSVQCLGPSAAIFNLIAPEETSMGGPAKLLQKRDTVPIDFSVDRARGHNFAHISTRQAIPWLGWSPTSLADRIDEPVAKLGVTAGMRASG